mgnify:CR=1 FL=1
MSVNTALNVFYSLRRNGNNRIREILPHLFFAYILAVICMLLIIRKRVLFFYAILLISVLLFIFGRSFLSMSIHKNAINNKPDYTIMIEIDEKKLYLYEDGQFIKKYPIATGMYDMPSPIGTWKITNKGRWGKGYGGRWMGLDVPWGRYGIHGTTRAGSIGRAASHGCIRMFNKDIRELYDMVPVGTHVIIRNGPYGPFGTGFRNLRPGDKGADVLAVQERLKELGYYAGNADGIYGEILKKAVHRFQADQNLEVKNTITQRDYDAMGLMEFE